MYVAQPEVKPGCVFRRSNIGLLENKKLVTGKEVGPRLPHIALVAKDADEAMTLPMLAQIARCVIVECAELLQISCLPCRLGLARRTLTPSHLSATWKSPQRCRVCTIVKMQKTNS